MGVLSRPPRPQAGGSQLAQSAPFQPPDRAEQEHQADDRKPRHVGERAAKHHSEDDDHDNERGRFQVPVESAGAEFRITARAIDTVVPDYLTGSVHQHRLQSFRSHCRR